MVAINTTVHVTPDLGVPYYPGEDYMDLKERAAAACATMDSLAAYGAKWPDEITGEDNEIAQTLATAYAQDPIATSKKATATRVAALPNASLRLTNNILSEFGKQVVQESIHIRHLVTNKLILETENEDPRIRLRAAELLGKISDVGLFVEKREITIHETSTDELKATLREKLVRLTSQEPATTENAVDAEYEEISDLVTRHDD